MTPQELYTYIEQNEASLIELGIIEGKETAEPWDASWYGLKIGAWRKYDVVKMEVIEEPDKYDYRVEWYSRTLGYVDAPKSTIQMIEKHLRKCLGAAQYTKSSIMKRLIMFVFLLGIAMTLHSQRGDRFYDPAPAVTENHYTTPQSITAYLVGGVAGYEVYNGRPAGPEFRAGFLARYGGLAIQGGAAYNSYASEGVTRRFYEFEGGIGAHIMDDLAVTIGLAYYGFPDGSDGAFGMFIRPVFHLFDITPELKVTATGGLSFTDDWMAYSGLIGLSYTIPKG